MQLKNLTLCILSLIFLHGCEIPERQQADILVLNASVVNIKNGTTNPRQLVVINEDTIKEVTSMDHRKNYQGMQIIDAGGKFIMPGLWDNHVHFRGGDTLIEENKDLLPLFLSHGVTTVRDAGGDISKSVLQWREQIAAGKLEGPTIFTSGPKLDGPDPAWPGSLPVEDEQDISQALDSLQEMNVDFVKIYDGSLSAKAFYGIIKEAEEEGYPTTGHMPLSADFLQAVEYGLDGSEHLYYVLKACSPAAQELSQSNPGYGMIEELVHTYDDSLAGEVFKKLRDKQVFITPTLHIGQTLSNLLEVDHSQDSLLAFIGGGIRKTYQGRIESAKRARASGSKMRELMKKKSMEMIKPMYEAGVPLLAGSDCGPFNSYVYPGSSLHGELKRLVEAGLTPRQALSTSILHGPRFFGLQDSYGSIEAGKKAHLILLDSNPLKNIENLKELSAVIKQGEIYSRKDLEKMLKNLHSSGS